MAFHAPTPILRMFDEAKAREFYIDFLGFHVDKYYRPGVENTRWNTREMTVQDGFGNTLVFFRDLPTR